MGTIINFTCEGCDKEIEDCTCKESPLTNEFPHKNPYEDLIEISNRIKNKNGKHIIKNVGVFR